MTIARYTGFVLIAAATLVLASCHGQKSATTSSSKQPADPTGAGSRTTTAAAEVLGQQSLFIEATKEKITGNYDKALAKYAQCLQVNPKNAAAAYEMAAIYMASNHMEMALPLSKQAADLDPKNYWYQLQYARILQKANLPKNAVEVLGKLTKAYPDREDFLSEYAYAQAYASDYDGALKTFDKIETMMGGPTASSLQQKLKIVQTAYPNDNDKQMAIVRQMIALDPHEGRYYGMLGDLYQKAGQPELALDTYNKLLEVDPGNGYAHISISEYYHRKGDEGNAYRELLAAFNNSSVDIDTKIRILLNNYYVKNPDDAQKAKNDSLCALLVKVHPEEAKAWSMRGDFLVRDGQTKEARSSYRKAVDLDKGHYAVWSQLIALDAQSNDVDQQIADSKEAAELFPTQPEPYFFWGTALVQKQQYGDALSPLRTGVAYVIDNAVLQAQFYSAIGDAYNGQKLYADADRNFDKALALDPRNAYALNNYSYYLCLRGEQLDKSEEMAKKANEISPGNQAYEDTYAWVLYRRGNYTDALQWMEKAMAQPSDDGSLYEHYGDILFKNGRADDAVKQWKTAKEKGGGTDLLNKKISDRKLYE